MSPTIATVLHLEDSELDAELVRDRLERSGLPLVIELVSNQKDFVARLRGRRYDLILSDYQVPTFEGLAALELARAYQPDTPFIFVSGAMGEEFAIETLKRGATDYILKHRLQRLPSAVERALAENRERAERKRAEARATTILESMTEAFVVLDPEWRFSYVNAAFERLAKVRRVDVLGQSFFGAYPAMQETSLAAACRRVMAQRVTAELECYYEPCARWFAVKTYPADDGGICVQAQDVTEARRAAEVARASQERLKFALKAGRMGTWDFDLANCRLVCSDTCKANYGRGPADPFTYEDLAASVFEDDRARWFQLFEDAIARRADFEIEYRVRWPDGTLRWVQVRGSCSCEAGDGGGRVTALTGISFDITERKRVEQDLARLLDDERGHTALLERVANASRAVNAVLAADSIARIVTDEARLILGARCGVTTFTRAEDCTQEVRAIATGSKPPASTSGSTEGAGAEPEPVPLFDAELAAAVCRSNRPRRVPAHGGSRGRWGRIAAPLIGHGGKNLGVVQLADKEQDEFTTRDEAILVQLAAVAAVGIENARLYELLREQDKRKDEFLATLAHELRNPLAPVRNGLQILKLGGAHEQLHRVREMMERQLGHMVRLIDDLMDVSRITRGRVELRKERVSLQAVVDSALEVSRPLIESAGHMLSVQVARGLFLDADPTRMAQVISNLLNNAAKYTPRGGHITLTAEREGPQIILRVTDTGVGIPAEMLPRVFDMFTQVGRTLERSQGGLGIGLTLVRRLVEMHGGTVDVESPGLDLGATFTVCLPLAAVEEERSRRTPEAGALPPAPGTLRVLVVDDNTDGAESLALLLRIGGHHTRTAHTGPDGLQAARAFRPDVVFLDIGLPGMSGYEVAEQLRAEYGAEGPVLVALTGWGSDGDRRRSREVGIDHHLTKPVDAQHIQGLLDGLLSLR